VGLGLSEEGTPVPIYLTLILIAVIGALCLAMLALSRRRPGDGTWFGSGRGPASEEPEETRWVQVITEPQLLLTYLRKRFGELPAAVVARIEQGDPEWCEELLARAVAAGSLEDTGLLDETDAAPTTADSGHS